MISSTVISKSLQTHCAVKNCVIVQKQGDLIVYGGIIYLKHLNKLLSLMRHSPSDLSSFWMTQRLLPSLKESSVLLCDTANSGINLIPNKYLVCIADINSATNTLSYNSSSCRGECVMTYKINIHLQMMNTFWTWRVENNIPTYQPVLITALVQGIWIDPPFSTLTLTTC